MRDYGQIVSKVKGSPWLITEPALTMLLDILDRRMAGERLTDEEIRARLADAGNTRTGRLQATGGIAVLPLQGPIFPKANMMTEMSGATSLSQFQQQFRSLLNNDMIDTIVLDVDSPGGMADMVPEMAQEIYDARSQKRIISVANTMSASAAYFLASQAEEMYVTPSGKVGSIGTYVVHTDTSEALSKLGVKETVIKAGRFKAELLPSQPLSGEAKNYLQEMVNEVNDDFLQAVARGRGKDVETVASTFGEGRLVTAKNALELGMVDDIQTLDGVLGSLLSSPQPVGVSQRTTPISYAPHTISTTSGVRQSLEKEKEHSEPGTGLGGEPQPRTPPEDEDIDDWKNNGGRLEKPPGILESEVNVTRQQLEALAARLDIATDDVSDDELYELVQAKLSDMVDEVTDVREAAASGTEQLEFAKQFPEQAEQLRKLQEREQQTDAKLFASEFDRIGDSDKGLSTLAQQAVEDTYLKFAQRTLVVDDLRNLITDVANGVVQFGEIGSSRQSEGGDAPIANGTPAQNRQLFFERVRELMANDGLDRRAAIAEASQRYPALAEAYLTSGR